MVRLLDGYIPGNGTRFILHSDQIGFAAPAVSFIEKWEREVFFFIDKEAGAWNWPLIFIGGTG
jgi:hypothetical protein